MSRAERCRHCGKRRKGRKKRRREEAAWRAVSSAVALITAAQGDLEDYQVAGLTGSQDLELVIRAQAILAAVMLEVLAPESSARALRHVGLRALEKASK